MNREFAEGFLTYQKFDNEFISFNPLSKLNILFSLGFTAMIIKDWRYGMPLCIVFWLFSALIGRLKVFTKGFSIVILFFGIFTLVVRQFSVEGEIILLSIFGYFDITYEALINGLNMASSLLGFSGAIILFFISTEIRDLMYSFEKIGVSHTVSYVMLASFQTIKDLKKSTNTIMESQKSRGIETEGNIKNRITAFFPILGPLILSAISSTEEKLIAMDARGFSVECKHTFLRELKPVPIYEKIICVLFDLFLAAVIILKIYFLFFKGKA
jgi:energy-coupling factor transporter transmembrane protein EcfT